MTQKTFDFTNGTQETKKDMEITFPKNVQPVKIISAGEFRNITPTSTSSLVFHFGNRVDDVPADTTVSITFTCADGKEISPDDCKVKWTTDDGQAENTRSVTDSADYLGTEAKQALCVVLETLSLSTDDNIRELALSALENLDKIQA